MIAKEFRFVFAAAALLLANAGAAAATVITVGDDEPGAHYRTLQEGLDVAMATGGFREVRVASGVYRERLDLELLGAAGTVWVTGGWDPTFTTRSLDPAATVVDNVERGGGSLLTVLCDGGRLHVEGLTFTGGSAPAGAGVRYTGRGTCSGSFERVRFYANMAELTDGVEAATGAGLFATLTDGARLQVLHSRFEANRALNHHADGPAFGGGLRADVRAAAYLLVAESTFTSNFVEGGYVNAAGLAVDVSEHALAEVRDSEIVRNVGDSRNPPDEVGVGAHLRAGIQGAPDCEGCGGTLRFYRNQVLENRVEGPDPVRAYQVLGRSSREATLTLSDSLVAGGWVSGASLLGMQDSILHATNLTIANHAGLGLEMASASSSLGSLANSIVAINGEDLRGGGYIDVDNLIGGAPQFVDPVARNYRLRPSSPAVDAGSLAAPGGLGAVDLDFRTRVVGASVDQGAYELQRSRDDSCAVLDPLQVPSFVPACTCLSDPSLREIRCAFFHHDLFVDLRTPFPLAAGEPFDVTWTVHTWRGLEAPYELQASLLVDGQRLPLGSPKGGAPMLRDGKLTGGTLKGVTLEKDSVLRTHLLFWPEGDKGPRELALDALLDIGKDGQH